jgi:hypothetical protein
MSGCAPIWSRVVRSYLMGERQPILERRYDAHTVPSTITDPEAWIQQVAKREGSGGRNG